MGPLEDDREFDAPIVISYPPDLVVNLIEWRLDRDLTRQDVADRLANGTTEADLRKLELLSEYPDETLLKQYAIVAGLDVEFV